MLASFKIHQLVVGIGNYSGHMIVETDKPLDIHYVTSVFAAFKFKVEPVRRCDGCSGSRGPSHRISQEKRSLSGRNAANG
jgi:hypothetical protein